MADDRGYETGMAVRRAVLGDEHVDRAIAAATPFTAPFQDYITRNVWGDIWTRPGLDRATRSVITLSVLTALGHEQELAMHLRAARRNGLTAEQIGEVLLQVGAYAGVPAANRAFAVAQRVLAETDSADGPGEPGQPSAPSGPGAPEPGAPGPGAAGRPGGVAEPGQDPGP
jgi:4-carboxymuconolactone decarboxylase